MFLCSRVKRNGVSPYVSYSRERSSPTSKLCFLFSLCSYVLAVSVTKPRSGLMSLCSYVLLFTALAAAKLRYGVSPYVS